MQDRLSRLAARDWTEAEEAKLREELIFPILEELGYGDDKLNPIRRERSYELRRPESFEGKRRLSYFDQVRVRMEGSDGKSEAL